MNSLLLAEHFRTLFAADPVFAGLLCDNDQSSETLTRPCLLFAASCEPISGKGFAFDYTLTIWAEHAAEWPEPKSTPDPAETHAAAVQLVRDKLFGIRGHADSETITGAPSPRGALLQAALQAEAILDFRGWACAPAPPSIETHHFRTPVAITGCALTL